MWLVDRYKTIKSIYKLICNTLTPQIKGKYGATNLMFPFEVSFPFPRDDTLIPWACGPQDSGVHIRQNTHAHVTTIN